MDTDAKKLLGAASRYSYLGIFFGVAVAVGFFGGRWLDNRFHTAPWLSLVGLLAGIAAGFRELIRMARQSLREEEADDAPLDKDAGAAAPSSKKPDDSK